MPETPGQRLYLIRLACGDGARTPEPMKAFVVRVERATGAKYHANAISLLERDEQGWKLDDVNTFSSVDPKKRGASWLAWGDVGAPAAPKAAKVSAGGIPAPRPGTAAAEKKKRA
jgi:hypothetical protein